MSSTAVVVLSVIAFLSAPPAFILLWILYRRLGERAVRELAFLVLGLSFILLGNLLTGVAESVANAPRGAYVLLLDEVTIASIMTGAYACRFAYTVTQTPITPPLRIAFWSYAFVLHSLVLAIAILRPDRDGSSIEHAFVLVTLGNVAIQIYATILVVTRRGSIPDNPFLLTIPRDYVVLVALGVLAAAGDVFQIGRRLGGENIPFSPIFCLIIDGVVIAVVCRILISPRLFETLIRPAHVDYGLTQREAEILPLLLEGATNEEIGERLHISPHTVKNHVTVIYRKTGAESRFDLLKAFNRTVVREGE
jgi:DNA-binding CsgD family transcriptional regulator